MIKVIVFSKDRPMQLHAYLDSLEFCIGSKYDLYVITPKSFDKEYYPVFNRFYKALDIPEDTYGNESFDTTIREFVKTINPNDHILFGCDDVVYTRHVNIDFAQHLLNKNKNLVGVSLRLGINTKQFPTNISGDNRFIAWDWTIAGGHWGYPFDLMGSIYSAKLVNDIISSQPVGSIKTPNFLEAKGVGYIMNNLKQSHPIMACLNSESHLVAQDVNRVQTEYPNATHGQDVHDVNNLKSLYHKGLRIDWRQLWHITPDEPFVGDRYWKFVEDKQCDVNG